jgi:hypothetical protein
MEITGKITGIKYEICFSEDLQRVDFQYFNINNCASSCLISNGKWHFALSKWVSPKRTRSYPYERVYNTLTLAKKITVIPLVKDEGAKGDRDFIQWDTVSLMSLLDVYVIFAYYDKADAAGLKITNQQFDNDFVKSKIQEIANYHSSALHWNLNELNTKLPFIIEKVQSSYREIEEVAKVKLHNVKGLDRFQNKISGDVQRFLEFSRQKAKEAQQREFVTIQPKEVLQTLTKAKITITNYLGGLYFFTVDEILIKNNEVYLIEGKHSKNTIFPSKSDIKDGLIKMILYSNLEQVKVDNKELSSIAMLELTSTKAKGDINSQSTKDEIADFIVKNNLNVSQTQLLYTVLKEGKDNNFIVKIKGV